MAKRALFIFILLLIIGYIGISYYFANMVITPRKSGPFSELQAQMIEGKGFDQHPIIKDYQVPTEAMLETFDGLQLSTWHFPKDSSTCAIIFAHGWGANRFGMFKYISSFEECNCDLVFFDHRGHYRSEGEYGTGGVFEAKDLLMITDWLQEKTGFADDQIAWVGASWGAATVLTAGATDKNVAFIVADSPFESWESAVTERAVERFGSWTLALLPMVSQFVKWKTGVGIYEASAIKGSPNIEEPVFLIHSQTDEATGSQQSVRISKNLKPNNSVFHHTDWGSGHTRDFSQQPEKAKKLLQAFLAEKVDGWGFCQTSTNQ